MLSVRGLTKIYAGRPAVEDVSFDLQPGTVTAFLGPNGAGKSTTLRMITGLTPPTRGGSWIAGRPFRDWANPAHVAGVLLDASAVHPGRTGGSHMRNAATLMGVPARRADDLMVRVGLGDATRKKIGKYSLGGVLRAGQGLPGVRAAPPEAGFAGMIVASVRGGGVAAVCGRGCTDPLIKQPLPAETGRPPEDGCRRRAACGPPNPPPATRLPDRCRGGARSRSARPPGSCPS